MAKGFDIMKEIGKIIETSKDIAIIELDVNRETCKSCPAHTLCGILPSMRKIKALNTLSAKVGDLVEIEVKREPSLKFAFLVYIAPLIMFFIGVILASTMNKPQNIQLLAGGIFFVLSFVGLYILNKIIQKSHNYLSEMERIIGHL